MIIVAYTKLNSGMIAFLMSANTIEECPVKDGYDQYVIEPKNINVPIDTLLNNYDQFMVDPNGTVYAQSDTLVNRKLENLDISTGMAIGHANTANIFTRL